MTKSEIIDYMYDNNVRGDYSIEQMADDLAEQTEPQTCSVNGRPYDCGNCEYHKCMADEPQTDCQWK